MIFARSWQFLVLHDLPWVLEDLGQDAQPGLPVCLVLVIFYLFCSFSSSFSSSFFFGNSKSLNYQFAGILKPTLMT